MRLTEIRKATKGREYAPPVAERSRSMLLPNQVGVRCLSCYHVQHVLYEVAHARIIGSNSPSGPRCAESVTAHVRLDDSGSSVSALGVTRDLRIGNGTAGDRSSDRRRVDHRSSPKILRTHHLPDRKVSPTSLGLKFHSAPNQFNQAVVGSSTKTQVRQFGS